MTTKVSIIAWLIAAASLCFTACTDDDVPSECAQYTNTKQAELDFLKEAIQKDENFTCSDYLVHSLLIANAIKQDIPDLHDEDDPRIQALDSCAGPWAKEAGISTKNYNKHSVKMTQCMNKISQEDE